MRGGEAPERRKGVERREGGRGKRQCLIRAAEVRALGSVAAGGRTQQVAGRQWGRVAYSGCL